MQFILFLLFLIPAIYAGVENSTMLVVHLDLLIERPASSESHRQTCDHHIFHPTPLREKSAARPKRQAGLIAAFVVGGLTGAGVDRWFTSGTTKTLEKNVMKIQKEVKRVTDDLRLGEETLRDNQVNFQKGTNGALRQLEEKIHVIEKDDLYNALNLADIGVASEHLLLLIRNQLENVDFDVSVFHHTAKVARMSVDCEGHVFDRKVNVRLTLVGRMVAKKPYLLEGKVCGLPLETANDITSCVKTLDPAGHMITSNGFICFWGGTGMVSVSGNRQSLVDGCYEVGLGPEYIVDGAKQKDISVTYESPEFKPIQLFTNFTDLNLGEAFKITPMHVGLGVGTSILFTLVVVGCIYLAYRFFRNRARKRSGRPTDIEMVIMGKHRVEEDDNGKNNQEKQEEENEPMVSSTTVNKDKIYPGGLIAEDMRNAAKLGGRKPNRARDAFANAF